MKRHVIFIVEGEDDDRTFARESHPSLTSVKKGFDVLLGMSAKVYSSNAVTVKRSEQQKRNIIIIIIIVIIILIFAAFKSYVTQAGTIHTISYAG